DFCLTAIVIEQLKGRSIAEGPAIEKLVRNPIRGLVDKGGARRDKVWPVCGIVEPRSQVQLPFRSEVQLILGKKSEGLIALVDVDVGLVFRFDISVLRSEERRVGKELW